MNTHMKFGLRAKRNILFFLLFSGIAFGSNRTYAQDFKFMGGAAFAKYSGTPAVGWILDGSGTDNFSEYKPGISAGIGIELFSSNSLSLEIDGLYTQKGCRFDFSDALWERKFDFYLNVLSFPVLLKFQFLPKSSPYILAGSELSIILSHQSIAMIQGVKGPKEDERERVETIDLALIIGGGFELAVKPVSFFIEARYHLGIQDISKDKLYFASLKTSAVVVYLGIKI